MQDPTMLHPEAAPDVAQRFATLEGRESTEKYNYEHFRTAHLVKDGIATARDRGIRPGEVAPDFELPRAGGGTLRLTELRGRPVLLHIGSYT